MCVCVHAHMQGHAHVPQHIYVHSHKTNVEVISRVIPTLYYDLGSLSSVGLAK